MIQHTRSLKYVKSMVGITAYTDNTTEAAKFRTEKAALFASKNTGSAAVHSIVKTDEER